MAGYRGARFNRRVQWMWMFAFLAYCYSVGSVVLPETPDANEAVRGEDADALEASWLASMPADIRAKINKINDESAKELDADRNWPFEDDFPSGQSMTNHEAASFLQLDSTMDLTDDASTKLNEDPNALKTGLNDPIDIQTKIADEGSSFIQEEASTDSTKTKFNEVGSLPGYFCVAEAEADHDCVISPEHAKIQQDCNQIAKERDTVCGFKIGLAGSCKAATNFYHKTCKQNPARKVHHWQGGMGLGKQTNNQALLQESTGYDQVEGKILGSGDQESAVVSDFHATLGITQGDLDTFNNNGLLYTNDVVNWAHGYLDGARTLSYVKTKIAGGQSSNSVIQDFGAIQSSNSARGISRSLPSGSTLMQRGGWNAVARDTWVEIQVFHSYAYTDSGANGVWWSRKFTVRCFKVTCPYNQGIGVGGTCNNCFKLATGCSSLTNQTWSELSSCNNDGFAVL